MRQLEAIDVLTKTLQKDEAVQAIFLKGSFGRGEGDEYSDVDLYVMVADEEVDAFLPRRLSHLEAYRPILLKDDIYIVAPQLIVVYNNFLHVDLFTVTAKTLNHQDEIKILFDPGNLLTNHTSSLHLPDHSLYDHAFDAVWFFFQYTKARDRGNDIWAVEMLRQGMTHFAYCLAAHHRPERASLGLKDIVSIQKIDFYSFYEELTPSRHSIAAKLYVSYLEQERAFFERIPHFKNIQLLYDQLIEREKSPSS